MCHIKKAFLMLMGLVIIAECGGCNIFVSEIGLKHTLENALEEKYDEEFECLDVWANGGVSYWGICSPKKNKDIRFKVLFWDDGNILEEGYYDSCVSEKIEKTLKNELNNIFDNFYLHSYFPVPLNSSKTYSYLVERVKEHLFDIEEYVNIADAKWPNSGASISLIICVNSSSPNKLSFEKEYDMLSSIIQKLNNVGIRTYTYLKILPEERYLECIEYLEKKASINSQFDDMVRDYPVCASQTKLNIHFECEGILDELLTKEEYINQRKE